MPGGADEVERYITAAPESRRPALTALRVACREELAAFQEAIEYGMPSYSRAGAVEVAFASQKQSIALYLLRTDVMVDHRARLAGLNVGKGAIRYSKPTDIDFEVVRSMLSQTASSTGPIC